MNSPACAPQMSMSEARRAVLRLLPGATVKRRLLFAVHGRLDQTTWPAPTPGHATVSEDEAGPSTHPRPTVAELELCGTKPRNRDRARIGNIARPIANFDPKHEVK